MTDPLDDPLRELSAALDVDPSPDFGARVRREIRQEVPASRRSWWLLAATAAAIVLLVVAGRMQPARQAAPQANAIVAPAEAPVSVPQPPRDAPAAMTAERLRQQTHARAVTARYEPETLIAPDQAIAFQRLVRLVYEGRIVFSPGVPTSSSLGPVEPPADVVVPPVEVKPVVIDPLVVDSMSNQEG